MTEKIEHEVEYFGNKTTAVVRTVDKLAEENNEVREYVTVIHDRRDLQRSSELKRNKTEDFMVINRYHEEGYGIDENIDFTNRLISIEEHVEEFKKANSEALMEFRE